MDVLYACDGNYVWLTAISMRSLLESEADPEQVRIFLIGDGVSAEEAEPLQRIAQEFDSEFILLQGDCLRIPEGFASNRWPRSAFLRLFAASVLPEDVEKVVYLDSDTIVRGSLIPLLDSLTATDAVFAGVLDCVSALYKRNIGLSAECPYVNAGVLAMSISQLRCINVEALVSNFLKRYGRRVHYADQDILNGAFVGRIADLGSPEFNVTTQVMEFSPGDLRLLRTPEGYYETAALEAARRSPVIIHYTSCLGIVRPWFENSQHTARAIFQDFRSRTVYSDRELVRSRPLTLRTRLMSALFLLPKSLVPLIVGPIHSFIVPLFIRGRSVLLPRRFDEF